MIDVDTSFFQLVFDNYTAAAKPSDASPATSYSRGVPTGDFAADSSYAILSQELSELRQQLQAMKRRSIAIMDQSRKSLERERAALQQAQEALELKETAQEQPDDASRKGCSRPEEIPSRPLQLLFSKIHEINNERSGKTCPGPPLRRASPASGANVGGKTPGMAKGWEQLARGRLARGKAG